MAYYNNNPVEPDRRSAVSSFYGARPRSSYDALNASDPSPISPAGGGIGSNNARHDRDDASSFYGSQGTASRPRGSTDLLVSHPPSGAAAPAASMGGAGYNRNSYFDLGREAPVKGGVDEDEDGAFLGQRRGGPGPSVGGRDEEAGWDVFADFNNMGPRYSSAFVKYEDGYQEIPPESSSPATRTPPSKFEAAPSTLNVSGAPVELVTVPALGAEWKKSELEAMTKKGRRNQKDSNRWNNFRAWTRDQRGCCGRYGTRKQVVIVSFVLIIIIIVALVFTIPRVPSFSFNSSSPLQNRTGLPPTIFSRSPANFSFAANLDLKVSTQSNFLPLKFKRIDATIFDLDTAFQVGTGNLTGMTVPAKAFTEVKLPLNFTYIAPNASDVTWLNWYDACRNSALNANGTRPGLNFRVQLEMHIAGLIGGRQATTQITNVECPVELSESNA